MTQVRGFEKFTEGRPFYEMPGITSRICGICPISHLLASSKACDAIMAVRIPPAAKKLRELVHCAQIVQSHALSFFYLSSPDLLLGMDSDLASRNVLGVIAAIRKWRATASSCANSDCRSLRAWRRKECIHPGSCLEAWPSPLAGAVRDRILADLPSAKAIAERTLRFFKGRLDNYKDEIESFGSAPTMYAGLVDRKGTLQFYDGTLRFRGPARRNRRGWNPGGRLRALDWRGQPARLVSEGARISSRRDFLMASIASGRWRE